MFPSEKENYKKRKNKKTKINVHDREIKFVIKNRKANKGHVDFGWDNLSKHNSVCILWLATSIITVKRAMILFFQLIYFTLFVTFYGR